METSGSNDPQPRVTPPNLSGGTRNSSDWPSQAADTIVNVVETVRDRTTGPIMVVARALVFGVFIGTIGTAVIVLAIIGVIRLLDEILPSSVWLPYLVLGLVFVLAGVLIFRRRNQSVASGGSSANR
jgi:hypothetical protein